MKQTLALKLLLGLALTLGAVPVSAQPQQVAASMSPAADAGTRTCLTCHGSDPKVTAILKSPMAVMGDPRTPFAQGGCVSCHGPSADHIAMKAPFPDIVFAGPHKSPAKARNEVCLSCHQGSPMVMNWEGSGMQRNRCRLHRLPHRARGEGPGDGEGDAAADLLHLPRRTSAPTLISTRTTRSAKAWWCAATATTRMGGPGDTKDLKEFTVNETCYNCHADKRGPMLWEHQPVRDNCLNCHTPHGSNQPRLMIEPTSLPLLFVPQLGSQ